MCAKTKKRKKKINLSCSNKENLSDLNNSPSRATLNVNLQGKAILLVLRYYLEIMIVFVVETGIHIIKVVLF